MENKKTGLMVLIFSFSLLVLFILILQFLRQEAEDIGCFKNSRCQEIEQSLNITHLAFGIFGFLFSLGFYLVVFSKGEEAIIKRLEADTNKKLKEDKFSILSKGLDEYEKKVVSVVKEEEGITQNTLRLRADMSKAKLSQVLLNLEKKNLVKREKKGKTLAIFFKEN